MRYYQVTYGNFDFIASHIKHDNNWHEILLGGARRKCIIVHIYPKDEFCTLIDAFHDKECNLTEDLPKKSGTIEMISAGIALCKKLYPKLKYMSLQDESVIKCGNGKNLPLSDVYMLLYGQTWYQNYFNATPVQILPQISRLSKMLRKKPHIEWDTLWNNYLRLGYPNSDKNIIKHKYHSVQSWHEFFQSIRENNCVYWYEWLSLLTKTLAQGTTITGSIWNINIDESNDNTINCIIKQIEKPTTKLTKQTHVQRLLFGGRTRK